MLIDGRVINQIVVSGCSFTAGDGLQDSKTESWPAQLAALLGVECINLARSGLGNEHVRDSVIDYFCYFPDRRTDSFVIPCFSSYSRVEFTSRINKMHDKWATIYNGRIQVDFTQKFFAELFDPPYYYARYIRSIITIQQTLNNWHIPYLMFEGLSGNPHKEMIPLQNIKKLIDQIDRSRWLKFGLANFDTMTDRNHRLLCGHPDAFAHGQMANILYEHIINNYATE